MHPGLNRLFNAGIFATTLLLCREEGIAANVPRAALTVFVDGTGRASASILIGALLAKPEQAADALGAVLGTGARDPQLDVDTEKHVVTCRIESAGRFDARRHQVHGQIGFAPLLPLLQSVGVARIELQFTHPHAAFSRCTSLTETPGTEGGPWTDYTGTLPLGHAAATPVRFEFGYPDKDLWIAFAPLALLAPLPLAWGWSRGRRRSSGAQAGGVADPLGVAALLAWCCWIGVVAALQADVIIMFIGGFVQPFPRMLSGICLVVLPPVVVLGAGRRLLVRHPAEQTGDPWANACPVTWAAPALFAALGLATWRDGAIGLARAWWVVAGVSTLVVLGQRAWVAGLGRGDPRALESGASRPPLERALAVKGWWLETVIVVGLPVLGGWVVRRFQIEQPASSLGAGAALVAAVILVSLLKRFLPTARTRSITGSVLSLLLRVGLAWVACALLDLPCDLEHGDEGLVSLVCVGLAAGWAARSARSV